MAGKYWYMFTSGVNENSVGAAIVELFRQLYVDPSIEVTLYISSIGGDIDSAIRFYDFIKASKINLKTVGFGQVDSAAIIILLSGTKRVLLKDCRVRLHMPLYNGAQGAQVISVHEETVSLCREIDKRYFGIMAGELGMAEEKIREILSEGKIVNAAEAKSLKIATDVEDSLPIDRQQTK